MTVTVDALKETAPGETRVALIPETATRLRFEGVVLRRMATRPARPVEMVFTYRKDNDNPMLRMFRRDVLEKLTIE